MKCEQCGANIGIEDERCPYCGTENSFAKQHIRDMRRFSQDYQRTKSRVLANSRNFARVLVPGIILSVLIVVVICIATVWHSDLEFYMREKYVQAHADEYVQKIDEYLQAGEYSRAYNYYYEVDAYLLDYEDEGIASLQALVSSIAAYESFFTELMRLNAIGYPYYENIYGDEDTLDNEYEYLAQSYSRIINWDDVFSTRLSERDEKIVEELQSRANALIVAYTEFPKDQLSQAKDYSESRLASLMKGEEA